MFYLFLAYLFCSILAFFLEEDFVETSNHVFRGGSVPSNNEFFFPLLREIFAVVQWVKKILALPDLATLM